MEKARRGKQPGLALIESPCTLHALLPHVLAIDELRSIEAHPLVSKTFFRGKHTYQTFYSNAHTLERALSVSGRPTNQIPLTRALLPRSPHTLTR